MFSRRSLARSSGFLPAIESPRTRTVPSVGVSMQPRMDSSVVLPLPDGPISSVSSPPLSARSTPLSARICATPVAEVLGDARCFHHQLAHRVNTMAGSMRVTFMIAAIAETTHITTVSTNSATVSPGVMTIGSALAAVMRTTRSPTR